MKHAAKVALQSMTNPSTTTRIGDLVGSLPALAYIRAWKRASGPIFGEKAKFHGVETLKGRTTLVISIVDPIWKQELSFQKQTLLDLYRIELEKEGLPQHKIPVDISLDPKKRLPFKTRNSQSGRNK